MIFLGKITIFLDVLVNLTLESDSINEIVVELFERKKQIDKTNFYVRCYTNLMNNNVNDNLILLFFWYNHLVNNIICWNFNVNQITEYLKKVGI